MPYEYEINEMVKEDSWRMFRIIGELVEGFDTLTNVPPAVSVYGSARIKEGHELYEKTVEITSRLGKMGFSIITGGGPGVMEAANKGAIQAGVTSVGLNITLPEEQGLNPYTTKSITFHHFFVRKIMLVKYTCVFIIMPGGLGTLDEVTELLTLMQTHKIKPFPVILFDSDFWGGFLDWLRSTVLDRWYISEEDFDLLRVCDSADEVIMAVRRWSEKQEVVGKKALAA